MLPVFSQTDLGSVQAAVGETAMPAAAAAERHRAELEQSRIRAALA
jgi:hypothetical protein